MVTLLDIVKILIVECCSPYSTWVAQGIKFIVKVTVSGNGNLMAKTGQLPQGSPVTPLLPVDGALARVSLPLQVITLHSDHLLSFIFILS